jgi:hypothetical protein
MHEAHLKAAEYEWATNAHLGAAVHSLERDNGAGNWHGGTGRPVPTHVCGVAKQALSGSGQMVTV